MNNVTAFNKYRQTKRDSRAMERRYHVRNDYTGQTYWTYNMAKQADIRKDHEQLISQQAGTLTTWYVVDTGEQHDQSTS